MIATDVAAAGASREMGAAGARGRDQLQDVHGLSGRAAARRSNRSSRAMLRAGELGALIYMHAETGLPIDVLVERAYRRRPHRADLSRADAPRGRGGHRHRSRDRARRDGEGARLHRASVGAARARARPWRRAIAACRRTRRPARSICSSRRTTCAASRATSSRAPSTCARRRCDRSTTTITCGAASRTTTCKVVSTIQTARSA